MGCAADLLASEGGGGAVLPAGHAWVGVLVADEGLVEEQAVQEALGGAGAEDDAVVQCGHHDGPRMQPVDGPHCLNLHASTELQCQRRSLMHVILAGKRL